MIAAQLRLPLHQSAAVGVHIHARLSHSAACMGVEMQPHGQRRLARDPAALPDARILCTEEGENSAGWSHVHMSFRLPSGGPASGLKTCHVRGCRRPAHNEVLRMAGLTGRNKLELPWRASLQYTPFA